MAGICTWSGTGCAKLALIETCKLCLARQRSFGGGVLWSSVLPDLAWIWPGSAPDRSRFVPDRACTNESHIHTKGKLRKQCKNEDEQRKQTEHNETQKTMKNSWIQTWIRTHTKTSETQWTRWKTSKERNKRRILIRRRFGKCQNHFRNKPWRLLHNLCLKSVPKSYVTVEKFCLRACRRACLGTRLRACLSAFLKTSKKNFETWARETSYQFGRPKLNCSGRGCLRRCLSDALVASKHCQSRV